jgi:hypothetical protein
MATRHWTGAIDNDFQNAGNWSDAVAVNGDAVVYSTPLGLPITMNVPAITLTSLDGTGFGGGTSDLTGATVTLVINVDLEGGTFGGGRYDDGGSHFVNDASTAGSVVSGTWVVSNGSILAFQNNAGFLTVSGSVAIQLASTNSGFTYRNSVGDLFPVTATGAGGTGHVKLLGGE